MKRSRLVAAGLLLVLPAVVLQQQAVGQAADNGAVAWSARVEPVQAVNGERRYRLTLTGRIAQGYIVYGSDFKAELGPNPTRVRFEAGQQVTPVDTLQSSGTRRGHDDELKVDYTYFEGEATLSQLITVATGATRVAGTVVGQTCHEADGTCALFRTRFEAALN